jgi:hypothetical protein
VFAASVASAHPQHTAVGDRYVKLVAEDGRLRVVYSVSYGPMGAADARQRMDANRDGRLTVTEAKAGARALGARLAREARLTVDGDPVALRWDEVFVGPPSGPVDTSPLTIELSAAVELPDGESVVRLVDVPTLENVERSDYGFEARPPAELLASGSGDTPSAQERLVSFLDRRARGPRVVSARVRLPVGASRTAWIAAGASAALIVAGVGVWFVRRRISVRRTGT